MTDNNKKYLARFLPLNISWLSLVSSGYRYVVLDVPLLFETRRLTKFLNHTVVVYW